MARIGDKGAYEVGNVKIIKHEENVYEQNKEARAKISAASRKTNDKYRTRFVDYLGNWMTIDQAIYAAGNVIKHGTVLCRLNYGWTVKEAIETPPSVKRNKWNSQLS